MSREIPPEQSFHSQHGLCTDVGNFLCSSGTERALVCDPFRVQNMSSRLLKQQMHGTLIFPLFVCGCTAKVGFLIPLPDLQDVSVYNFWYLHAELFRDPNEKDLHWVGWTSKFGSQPSLFSIRWLALSSGPVYGSQMGMLGRSSWCGRPWETHPEGGLVDMHHVFNLLVWSVHST